MKNEKETAKEPFENDPRLAYMIAWRDRYIATLQEQIAGWEEKDDLLCSLLFYALFHMTSEDDEPNEREARIDKAELADLLGVWECHAKDKGDLYCVRFTKKEESATESDAGEHADGGEAKES